MTEQIKTTKAWADTYETDVDGVVLLEVDDCIEMPIPYSDNRIFVHIVSGLSDPEAAALPEIMERERGVCEWGSGYLFTDCRYLMHGAVFEFCPSCGRKVVVK